jgi:hypothetical protein
MSFDATKWVRAQAFTDPFHRYLALEIADYADKQGKAWPSVETLAKVTLLSPRTVSYKLAEMEELGFLRREKRWKKGHQTSNLIYLAMKNMGARDAPMNSSKGARDAPMPPTMSAPHAPCMGAPHAAEPSKEEPISKKEPPTLQDAPSALAFEDAPLHMNGLAKEERSCPNKEASKPTVQTAPHAPWVTDTDAQFERFWSAYPRRDGNNPRKPAADKFRSLVEKHKISPEKIIRGAQRYAASVAEMEGPERRYIMQAITWLNREGWRDEYRKRERNKSYAELADEIRSSSSFEEWANGSPSSEGLTDFDIDLASDEWTRH